MYRLYFNMMLSFKCIRERAIIKVIINSGGITMGRRKGIMRHEALKPLSRHHMEGLHVALKLKRAGSDDSRWTVDEIKADAKKFWVPEGQNHFREEEEILLPAYASYGNVYRPEIVDMLAEHVIIRSQMNKLLETGDMTLINMHALGVLLENHIRKEERVIFPMIEKALPEEALIRLAPYLH